MSTGAIEGGRTGRHRVWLAELRAYDPAAIRQAVDEGMAALGVRPEGRLVAVADWTLALPGLADAAATRPEFIAGVLDSLMEADPRALTVLTGASFTGVAARRVAGRRLPRHPLFRGRGLHALTSRYRRRFALRPVDECRYFRYQLSVGHRMDAEDFDRPLDSVDPMGRYWDRVVLPWELFHADHVVLMPKLKTTPGGGFSGALRLQAFGLLRQVDRNGPFGAHGARAVADVLEVTAPSLVVSDGVEVGYGGSSVTQAPRPLGAVVVADNAVAHDVVCAQLLGVDPPSLSALRLAAARGYGPADLAEIEILGPGRMDLFQDRIRGFGPAPVKAPALMPERFEKDTGCPFPVTVMPPLPPESARAHPASCVVLEWMARVLDHPSTHEQAKWWPSITLVVDELEHRPHSPRVVLVGDTAARAFLAKATESQAWFKVPEALRRLLFGFSAAHRYGLRGGGRGWAFQVPGSPPRVRDLERALWWGSGFRIRSPLLLRLDLFLEWALFRIWPAFLRGRRNRRGIPVVHARKMGRTHGLTWRKRWATPSALELRELDKEALALRPSGDSQE